MYLVDTDVISEARKGDKANPGVRQFFQNAERDNLQLYLSAVTIGELRQGVEIVRHRGDEAQTRVLERWWIELPVPTKTRFSASMKRSLKSGGGDVFQIRRIRSTNRSPQRPSSMTLR
jgi:predicted nucleic acid-binding protein